MPATAPFEFLAPRTTWYGNGTLLKSAEGFADLLGVPTGTLLLIVDRSIAGGPIITELVAHLEASGYATHLETDFGPELTSEQVDAAAARGRDNGAVGVLGIGGGSVLDAAKVIALLLHNDGECADWFGVITPPNAPAPLMLAPTTVGTGAEVTRMALATHGGEKRIISCIGFVPGIAILDPELVKSLPAHVVAYTAMDALAHATEAVMSTISTVMTEDLASRSIRLIMARIHDAYSGDATARGDLLFASYLAGLSLNSGVVLGHSLGYAINHERPLPHGTTTGLALPYALAYNQHLDGRKRALIAEAVVGDDEAELRTVAEHIKQTLESIGQPATLDEAQVPEGVEAEMARRTVELYPRPTNPEPMDLPRVQSLILAMRTGDLDAAFAVTAQEGAQ